MSVSISGSSSSLGVRHVTGSVIVVAPQPVLGYDIHHDGNNDERDDDVEASRDAQQHARRVRQRQADALQKPEVVKRDFCFHSSVCAACCYQTFHKHRQVVTVLIILQTKPVNT